MFEQLPMFSRQGSSAYKKDLTNIRLLCNALGNPQNLFKTIHVGGTNGKGSVSHMLAAVLQTAGYKTGLYTSPHLYDFRERIKVNGQLANADFVVDFVQKMLPEIEKIQPSFFEITVAMAFAYFAEQQVDIAVVEVGLGGRLDSTNIINPELSVITNIGLDHMNLLGNSLAEIAFEKAGIIKPGVPVVIGETNALTKPVFAEVAQQKNAPVCFADENQVVQLQQIKIDALYLLAVYQGHTLDLQLDLPALYQLQNVNTVLHGVSVLMKNGWKIAAKHLQAALGSVKKQTGLWGRWEVIKKEPYVVLDVAHNQPGVAALLKHLFFLQNNSTQLKAFNNLHVVLGMAKDKDVKNVLAQLPATATYYFCEAHMPRALPALQLQQQARCFNLKGNVFEDVNTAIEKAVINAAPADLILVCGSIFLVAEVKRSFVA